MRTAKGKVADILTFLGSRVEEQFCILHRSIDNWRIGCGGTARVEAMTFAAKRFSEHCKAIGIAQELYSSMGGPEEEE